MVIYKLGSQGEDIRQLQEQLNKNGYNLATNGIYDEQTQAAEKDYRAKQNVTSGGANIKAGPVTIEYLGQKGYDPNSNPDYVNAMAALEQVNKSAPTYNPSFDAQLEEMYNKIVNREDFKYDLNADALYEQYQDRFANMGQMAMQDTMGQAAALTGGYGSSYAQNAGQQAYNQYLAQLNDIVPDLYAQAYGRYQDEGQALMQQYGMLGDMADREYAMYMDQYNQWLAQQQMAREDADTAYNRGWNDFINAQQMQYQKDRDAVADDQWWKQFLADQEQIAIDNKYRDDQFDYQKDRDAVYDEQWNKQFEYGKELDDRAYQQWLQEFQYGKEMDAVANQQWEDSFAFDREQFEWQKQQQAGKTTTSSNETTTSSSGYDNEGLSTFVVKQMQEDINSGLPKDQQIKVDGKWGPETEAATGGLTAKEYYEAWQPSVHDKNIHSSTSAYWTR